MGLGYFVSFAILGLGVYLERKDLYRIFARALIGGGWALVFFTTYAMHFVTYTQVIDTEWVDLVLLFAVAWMMVAHTLRYNSQVVTGLAFLLGFTTVAISQNTVYCLGAGAILAIGLVAIVHERGWFELEVFGLIASYVNHYIWLRTVIEPMGGHKHMFPEFIPSAVLLCLYWAIYRWSYLARRIQRGAQEQVSTLAALLNTCSLLVLFKYQSVRPGTGFLCTAGAGRNRADAGPIAGGHASPANGGGDPFDDRNSPARGCGPVQILRDEHGDHMAGGSGSTVPGRRIHTGSAISPFRHDRRPANCGRHDRQKCGTDPRSATLRRESLPDARIPARGDVWIRGAAVLRECSLDSAPVEGSHRNRIRADLLLRAVVSRGFDDVRELVAGIPERMDRSRVVGSGTRCDAAGPALDLDDLSHQAHAFALAASFTRLV